MPESEQEGPPEPPEPAPELARPDTPDIPDTPDATELPATFGKYFLTEKLATGGMAEIYLAKIVGPGGFEKSLVIKQIHPRLSGQRHFVDLFVAEAKTLVTLAHGNIVPVYELGVIDDTYFIAMEYIDGPTLYRLTETLRRREVHMAPAIAAWITARILEGLDYAHHKGVGVIHRDLSPRNVMLSRDGEVKLVDFGIAVTLGGGSEDEGQSAPTGSFPYMSPEQVRKEPLTVQTDLFSVGVLFWEMLVGHRLFARSDPDATLHAVVDGDIVRPSTENPDVPPRLDDVVMLALERDMTSRWTSARDMLEVLQRYLYSLDETPGPRDVAALVARYCPPETRRYPTHHDVHSEIDLPHDTQPRAVTASMTPVGDAERLRPGPMTAVIPRDGGPRGKRHPRARTETFATHVALEQILEGGTPILGVAALRDDLTPLRSPANATPTAAPAIATDPSLPPEPLPGRMPPSGTLLVIAGVGAVVLAAAAVFVFFRGRDAVISADDAGHEVSTQLIDRDAAPRGDAGDPRDAAPALDATPNDGPAPAIDAAEPADAAPIDAGLFEPRRDAGPRAPRPDARDVDLLPRDAAVRHTGTATLTIGANPWGNVLLDGKKIGRTPIERLSVPAGRHVIEVIFAGEDPPRTSRHTVDLADGETKDVLADFTKP